jgi:hypothetical protein
MTRAALLLRQGQFEACRDFLVRSANDPAGAFQGTEFRREARSARAWCAAPWRGWFPRQPLRHTVEFEVLNFQLGDSGGGGGGGGAGPPPGHWIAGEAPALQVLTVMPPVSPPPVRPDWTPRPATPQKLEVSGSEPSPARTDGDGGSGLGPLGATSANLIFSAAYSRADGRDSPPAPSAPPLQDIPLAYLARVAVLAAERGAAGEA